MFHCQQKIWFAGLLFPCYDPECLDCEHDVRIYAFPRDVARQLRRDDVSRRAGIKKSRFASSSSENLVTMVPVIDHDGTKWISRKLSVSLCFIFCISSVIFVSIFCTFLVLQILHFLYFWVFYKKKPLISHTFRMRIWWSSKSAESWALVMFHFCAIYFVFYCS